jgi:hypothetical protein
VLVRARAAGGVLVDLLSARQRPDHDKGLQILLLRQQDQLLACDYFTVETLLLKTIFVLFFIELGTRRAVGVPRPGAARRSAAGHAAALYCGRALVVSRR